MTIRVAVSGIPRGYHGYKFPKPDGNWLQERHRRRMLETSPDVELIEVPADRVKDDEEAELALAEGGNTGPTNPVNSTGRTTNAYSRPASGGYSSATRGSATTSPQR
jgi:hypothetical protein